MHRRVCIYARAQTCQCTYPHVHVRVNLHMHAHLFTFVYTQVCWHTHSKHHSILARYTEQILFKYPKPKPVFLYIRRAFALVRVSFHQSIIHTTHVHLHVELHVTEMLVHICLYPCQHMCQCTRQNMNSFTHRLTCPHTCLYRWVPFY